MQKIILPAPRHIHPFNEPARDLRVQNKPLWLIHRDVLAPYAQSEREMKPGEPLPEIKGPAIVYRENLFFDSAYIDAFLDEARKRNSPSQAAFSVNDLAFREHALPLSNSYERSGDLFLADLWYYPNGNGQQAQPLVIDLLAREVGYYHVPTYMATETGDLTFQVPLRSILAIDAWVHIFIADVVFGLFTRGACFEDRLDRDPFFKLAILANAMFEGKQVLESSGVVKLGRNCVIDPSAIIHGPTTIGDNVTIGAGAVIENCIIGDNVNISQGCQLMLSVVGDGAFLPFRASMFMTTFMDNSMVAQNTCLQMCVVGRNTFIGAGSTFTDFNLVPTPLKALDSDGDLLDANRPVLGGCVGHNCRLGSGMIIFPARTIESDVVLVASPDRRVIARNLNFEDSDHHRFDFSNLHHRLYPRPGEGEYETW
jgi:UDP-N-acetylglucosamine diphosphorylase / glucose-1-phosphate thymidylyltransferase / UDP-N-acetylgalactosamine diphosphorylase / glucosamine-1-phosphate N-acetyltransferase / galactosamine-1-phosphate N-acetyltransferase